MSDNTPVDGTKHTETHAAASPDETARAQDAVEEPVGAASERADLEPEPLVINYDAINANLSAAENADPGAHAATPTPAPMVEPVASADGDASSLADDYADNSAPAATMPAEPVPAPVAPVPIASAPIASAPIASAPIASAPIDQAPATQSPIYVQAPTKPRDRGNRGSGILIAALATLVFAVLYAVAAFVIIGLSSTTLTATTTGFTTFAALPVFYIPVIFFFLAFSALIALVNRGGWWAYVLFGFLVALVVYFSYIGGALLGLVLDGTADSVAAADLSRFVASLWLNPGAIAAGLIAREVPIWSGAWIARRGRRVSARNLEARIEYERLLAEGPQLSK